MATFSNAAPRKRIAQEFHNWADEFSSFGKAYRANYQSAIVSEMKKLQDLDPNDVDRISIAVYDAARRYHSAHWRPILKNSLQGRFRVMAAMAVASLFVACIVFGFLLILPKPASAPTVHVLNDSSVTAVLLALLGVAYLARIPPRYVGGVIAFTAIAIFVAINRFQWWSAYPGPAWRKLVPSIPLAHAGLKAAMERLPVNLILAWALWIIGLACTLWIVRQAIAFFITTFTIDAEAENRLPAEKSAEVIICLLDIARNCFNQMPAPKHGECAHHYGDEVRMEVVTQQNLDCDLNKLAYLIEGPWQKSMRSYFGSVGNSMGREASRIAFFIRYQQMKNVLLGDKRELREAMTSALVNAADGNWHLIGAENEYSSMSIMRRRRRVIKRAMSIGIAILGAIVAHRLMTATYVNIIVFTCVSFAGIEILGLINPDAPSHLDMASRFASTFTSHFRS
jgi:hypothetical protein